MCILENIRLLLVAKKWKQKGAIFPGKITHQFKRIIESSTKNVKPAAKANAVTRENARCDRPVSRMTKPPHTPATTSAANPDVQAKKTSQHFQSAPPIQPLSRKRDHNHRKNGQSLTSRSSQKSTRRMDAITPIKKWHADPVADFSRVPILHAADGQDGYQNSVPKQTII